VDHVTAELGVSQRLACRVPEQHRSTQRKARRTADDEAALTQAIIDLATQYGRYGYRRITALLHAEGWACNHKRVERIWRAEGLKVPARQPKRGRLWLNNGSCLRLRPDRPNHVWAYDFVEDRTRECRKFRTLNVVDEFSRGAWHDAQLRFYPDHSVGAGHQDGAVREGQFVPAVAERLDASDLVPPPDRPVWQRLEQNPPQISAEHFWTPAVAVVGFVEQHRPVPVEHARSLAARVDDRAERVGEARSFERALPVVLMDVEMAALRTGLRGGLRLVDRRGNAVHVEDAGEDEAAGDRTDDDDWYQHGFRRLVRVGVPGRPSSISGGRAYPAGSAIGRMTARCHKGARSPQILD
jgi:hypothetical protein